MKTYQFKTTPNSSDNSTLKPPASNNPQQSRPSSQYTEHLGDKNYQPLNELLNIGKPTSTTSVTSTQMANIINSSTGSYANYTSNNDYTSFGTANAKSQPTYNAQFTAKNANYSQQSTASPQTNNNSSISDMKKRLQELLKQTQQLSEKRTGSSLSKNQDLSFSGDKNLSNSKSNSNFKFNQSLSYQKALNAFDDKQKNNTKNQQNQQNQSINNFGNKYKKQQPKLYGQYPKNIGEKVNNENQNTYSHTTLQKSASQNIQPTYSFNVNKNIINPAKDQSIYKFQSSPTKNKYGSDYNLQSSPSKNNLSKNLQNNKSLRQLKNSSSQAFNDFPMFKVNNEKTSQRGTAKIQNSLSLNIQSIGNKNSTGQSSKILKSRQQSGLKRPISSGQINYLSDLSDNIKPNTNQNAASTKKQKQQIKRIQIPNNLLQCQIKLRVLDQDFRKVKEDLVEMTDGKEYYRKELSQSWRNNKQQKDEYQQKIIDIKNAHAQQIQKYQQQLANRQVQKKNQIESIKQAHQQQIQKLQEIIRTKQEQKQVQIDNINEKHKQQILSLQETIKKKDQNLVKLVNELAQAKISVSMECFDQKAKKLLSSNADLINQITQREKEITQLKADLVSKDLYIDGLTQKIGWQKDQIAQLTKFKQQKFQSQAENFDQILKVQLQSIAQFKQMSQRLNQKNNQLRQKLTQSNRKNQFLANQTKILQLKFKSSFNNSLMESAIELTNKQNVIGSLNKKIMTMEEKYRSAMSEIRSKDQFFKQHLIGRADSLDSKQYIENVLAKYRQQFTQSKEEQLKAQLEKANKKIQLYEKYA